MKYIEIKAPAKINIGLNIVKKRDDGFHNLETFFYPINDLFDELTFERSDKFSFEMKETSIKYQDKLQSNLVVKAKNILEEKTGKKLTAKITLKKNIPIGAGLGGGSSDAASTLICLNEMFNLKIKNEQMIEIALKLGSDVPFFLKAKPAVGKSRGEILSIKEFSVPYYILLVNPGIHVSTKEAFASINPVKSNINYDDTFKDFNSFWLHHNNVRNDFENYVFSKHPEIKQIKELLNENGSLFSLMSGSGSTVYGFFESFEQALHTKQLFPVNYTSFISRPE
jgi:4-diphosphocytidyl-2-C-methyl-D-erythritol kinase